MLKYENGETLELKCADCNTPFPDGTKVKKNKKCENCNNQKYVQFWSAFIFVF